MSAVPVPPLDHAGVNAVWAATLVEALVAGGVGHVCVAPGARSTPLAWAVAERADGGDGDGALKRAHVVGDGHSDGDGQSDGHSDGHSDVHGHGDGEGRLDDDPAAAADPRAARPTCSVHLDERGAGFFAVGYAAATGRAVAIVCTSGTAAANLLPAVVEAHYSRLPLVVVTADRPPDLRDRGAWQAIDQVKLYGAYARWAHELGEPAGDAAALRYAAAVGARAAATALGAPRGPVHLNVPLREPLGPVSTTRPADGAAGRTPSTARADDVAAARAWSTAPAADHAPGAWPSIAPAPRWAAAERRADPAAVAALAARIAAERRGLVVAGRPGLDADAARAVARLAVAAGYPVLAEPLSGLRFGAPAVAGRSPIWVAGYDAFLRPDAGVAVPPPGLVLRVGGSVTWKHVAAYLEGAAGAWQAAIDPEATWDDPTGRIALRLEGPVAATLDAVAEALAVRSAGSDRDEDGGAGAAAADRAAWCGWWQAASAAVAPVRAAFTAGPGGAGAARGTDSATAAGGVVPAAGGVGWLYPALVDQLPDGALLAVANSMAVRDLDTFTVPAAKRLHVVCNRGAAGIDGTLSAALGAAFGAGRPAALVTGDLAFLHDAGGFGPVADLVARYGPAALDLFVVVVDDGGGGIFEHLGVAAADRRRFETFFATPQAVDIAALCRAWGVPCRAAPDASALAAAAAVAAPVRAAVVGVDRAANTAAHRAYWRAAADAVAAATAGRSA